MKAVTLFFSMCVVLTSCSSEPESQTVDNKPVPSVAQSSSTVAESPSTDPSVINIDDYMSALAANEPNDLRVVSDGSATDSPAALYAKHLANVNEAQLDGGSAVTESDELTRKGDAYELCYSGGTCLDYAAFEKDAEGRLVAFTINKQSIDSRLSQGDGSSVKAAGARFTFLTAYKSVASDALFVVLKVKTGMKKLDLNVYSATYRDPSGKQRGAGEGGGPVELDAQSNAYDYSVFVGVKPGGVMTLDGCIGDCTDQYEVKVKVG